jgi:hypothetical protein
LPSEVSRFVGVEPLAGCGGDREDGGGVLDSPNLSGELARWEREEAGEEREETHGKEGFSRIGMGASVVREKALALGLVEEGAGNEVLSELDQLSALNRLAGFRG